MYVYLLEYRQFNPKTNRYEFYNIVPFSSKLKIEQTVKNTLEVNKATDIDEDAFIFGNYFKSITYSCLSTDNNPMKMKLSLSKKKIK